MAELNEFISPKFEAQVNKLLVDFEKLSGNLLTIAGNLDKMNKTLRESEQTQANYSKALVEVEKQKQAIIKTDIELAKKEQQLQKSVQEEQKAAQQKIKTDQLKNKESEKAKIAAEKEASAYEKLNKQHKDAVKVYKDLAASTTASTKEIEKAKNKANEYGAKLDKINSGIGQNQSKVGSYFKETVKSGLALLGSLGLITGGVQLLSKGWDKLKESSQAFGDAFAMRMEQVNTVTYKFFSMLGTGQLENFWQNLKKAADAGKEYAQAMDDMMEGGLGLKIAESEARLLIAAQEQIRDNVNLTKEERIAAAKEINRIENELTKSRLTEGQAAFDAEKNRMQELVGINEQEFISFLKNFRAQSDLRDNVTKKIEAEKEAEDALNLARKMANYQLPAEIEKVYNDRLITAQNAYTNEEKIYKDYLKRYAGLSDDMIVKTAETYANITDIKALEIEETKKNNNKLNSFLKDLEEERIKDLKTETKKREAIQTESITNIKADLTNNSKQISANIQYWLNKGFDLKEATKRAYSEGIKTVEFIKGGIDSQEKPDLLGVSDEEMAKRRAKILLEVKKLQEEIAKEKGFNIWDSILSLNEEQLDQLKGAGIEMGNALYEIRGNSIKREMKLLDEKYEIEKEKAGNNQVAQTIAERKYEREKAKIERKQAINDRNQSLFNITITTAEHIAKAGLNPYLIAAYLALAAAQTAVVMSAVPGYDKGTESLPDGMVAVAEKRPEFITHKGKTWLQETPLITDKLKGAKVIGGEMTEKITKLAHETGRMYYDDHQQRDVNINFGFDNRGQAYVIRQELNKTTYCNYYK